MPLALIFAPEAFAFNILRARVMFARDAATLAPDAPSFLSHLRRPSSRQTLSIKHSKFTYCFKKVSPYGRHSGSHRAVQL